MDTSRVVVFASLLVISIMCLASSGSAFPRASGGKWRPVSFQTEQSITRRSYDIKDAEGTGRAVADATSWLPAIGGSEFRVLQKVLDDCFKSGDGLSCLKSKSITFLDRVSKIKSLPLFDGLAFVKQDDGNDDTHVLTENELEASLPRNLEKKNDRLDQMIYERLVNLWKSRNFVFDFSSDAVAEGRGKKHKKGMLVAVVTAGVSTMAALALKGLAALAFKALLVAKVALVLAAVVALKKLSHHGGEHRSYVESHEDSWVHNAHGRSFSGDSDNEETHKLAYSGHLRRPVTVT